MLFIINLHTNFMPKKKKTVPATFKNNIWMPILSSDAFGQMFQIMQFNSYSDL